MLVALREIEVELDATRSELTELAGGVHPRILTEAGLATALESMRVRSGLPIMLDVASDRLPPMVEVAVYFVCTEAIANVAKHAKATRIAIEVMMTNGHVKAEISDDGVGGADLSHGTGLRGLVDRVEALDGQMTVDSERGGGTTVRVTIPVAVPQS
jgi:signal transduction histidine kinase